MHFIRVVVRVILGHPVRSWVLSLSSEAEMPLLGVGVVLGNVLIS